MRWVEAREQLCKMQAEIAAHLGLETECVCVCTSSDNVVPDQVIEEMWRRLTHPRWSAGSIAAEMIEQTMRWPSFAEKGLPPMGVMEQCSVKDIREIADEEWEAALKQAEDTSGTDGSDSESSGRVDEEDGGVLEGR